MPRGGSIFLVHRVHADRRIEMQRPLAVLLCACACTGLQLPARAPARQHTARFALAVRAATRMQVADAPVKIPDYFVAPAQPKGDKQSAPAPKYKVLLFNDNVNK